jgi:hypothetical protein
MRRLPARLGGGFLSLGRRINSLREIAHRGARGIASLG